MCVFTHYFTFHFIFFLLNANFEVCQMFDAAEKCAPAEKRAEGVSIQSINVLNSKLTFFLFEYD